MQNDLANYVKENNKKLDTIVNNFVSSNNIAFAQVTEDGDKMFKRCYSKLNTGTTISFLINKRQNCHYYVAFNTITEQIEHFAAVEIISQFTFDFITNIKK